MVEKLGLKNYVHPTLHKVSWLHKGHHILVNEQRKIEFKISIYEDELLCDVIPMDACHVLLGRHGNSTREKFIMGGKIPILLKRMVGYTMVGYTIGYH
jgi:hypothetical protein